MGNVYGMGLRSFVALPVEKEGAVMRLAIEHVQDAEKDTLITNIAYGFSAKQTLLLGLPYRLSPAGNNRQGDLSVLYRQILWQEDSFSGTNRLGVLTGAVVPSDNDRGDAAAQAGLVFTHFRNRNEIDIDALYQAGIDNRLDTDRYDLSWQYRLSPIERPNWGVIQELNSVLELNGRWNEGSTVVHQVTDGLQWVHQKWVIEGGVTKDMKNGNKLRALSFLMSEKVLLKFLLSHKLSFPNSGCRIKVYQKLTSD